MNANRLDCPIIASNLGVARDWAQQMTDEKQPPPSIFKLAGGETYCVVPAYLKKSGMPNDEWQFVELYTP